MPTAGRPELNRSGAIGLLCLLPLWSCHARIPDRSPSISRGYTASLSLKVSKEGRRTTARGFLALLRGRLLRLELHGPGGGTRLLLVLQDGPSLLWVPGQAIYRGEGDRMLSRLLARDLPVSSFILALTGDEPAPGGLSIERTSLGERRERIVLSMDNRLTVAMKLRGMEPCGDSSRLLAFKLGSGDEERAIEALPSIWELLDR